jgi:uncharacterized protein YjgD (DUF1641 family)
MRFSVLKYKDTDNPRGFPGEYPAQTYPLRDGESVKAPWVEMDEAQLEELKQSLVAEVETIAQASRDSEKRSESDKLDALKRLFDEAEVIDDAWATATNAQKFDLARNTFKILRRIRGFILDQYRS